MNKSSKLSLFVLPLFLLGCSNNSQPYGKYSFIMGSPKGSHFGIYLNLTNEKAVKPSPETSETSSSTSELSTSTSDDNRDSSPIVSDYYKFTFKYENVTIYTTSTSESSAPTSQTSSTSEPDIGELIQDISGGYYIKADNTLSIDIYIWNQIVLPSDLLDDFLIITLSNDYSSVNINIPVSINDAFEIIEAKWEGREAQDVHTVDIGLAKE